MGARELEDLLKRRKNEIVKLREITEITRQIAEAVERRDALAIEMLLGEREQPVRELQELEEGIRAYLLGLSETDAIRLNELLHGTEAAAEEEQPLAEVTAQFRRMLSTVADADKKLSLRLGGNRSFYKKFRE